MDDICKIILVGESGVGKTCIIKRFITKEFNKYTNSTAGANYASKVLDYKEYKTKLQFDIWDTAGQEKFRGLSTIFYKDAAIAILVYDITNKQSFEEITKYWYEQIKENSSSNISKLILFNFIFYIIKVFGVAGNKSDLYLKEEVSYDEGFKFAQSIGACFKLTSASSNTGIEDLFKELGKCYLDPDYKNTATKVAPGQKRRSGTLKLEKTVNEKKKKSFFC